MENEEIYCEVDRGTLEQEGTDVGLFGPSYRSGSLGVKQGFQSRLSKRRPGLQFRCIVDIFTRIAQAQSQHKPKQSSFDDCS
jgi:hypothetical protein